MNPDLTFDESFEDFFTKDKSVMNWFKFNNEWLENKNKLNILYISYEQLKHDFDIQIEKIAKYLNVILTDEIKERIKKHSSFEYMKEHESKFGEIPPKNHKKNYNQFIRNGKIGEGNEYLNDVQKKYFMEKFDLLIKPFLSKF